MLKCAQKTTCFVFPQTFYPNFLILLHRYICHICDIMQLCPHLKFKHGYNVKCHNKSSISVFKRFREGVEQVMTCQGVVSKTWLGIFFLFLSICIFTATLAFQKQKVKQGFYTRWLTYHRTTFYPNPILLGRVVHQYELMV